ncbi:MAG: diacylglycerol/lipid kinase family protein [Candidatus Heimdallarchaeaceae archaeon]
MDIKWKFIVNPNAGLGTALEKWNVAEQMIKKYDIDYDVEYTSEPYQGEYIAKKAIEEGFNRLVAVSGDGVVNEVVNGIMNTPEEKRKEVILGILPFGTGNDYNTVLGFPWSPENAVKYLFEQSSVSPVSVGKMEVVDTGLVKYFNNVLDVGISSLVGHAANLGEGSFIKGPSKYTYLALKKLLTVKQTRGTICLDDQDPIDIKLMMITIGVAKCNGGGMLCCVDGHPQNDEFNVFITQNVTKLQTLIGIKRIKKGKHKTMKGTIFTFAKKVEIKVEKPIAFQFDGEVYIKPPAPKSSVGTHMKAEIIPQALNVFYNPLHQSMYWLTEDEVREGKLPKIDEDREWSHDKARKWQEKN